MSDKPEETDRVKRLREAMALAAETGDLALMRAIGEVIAADKAERDAAMESAKAGLALEHAMLRARRDRQEA